MSRYGPHRPEDVPEDTPPAIARQREQMNTLAWLGRLIPESIQREHERIAARADLGLPPRTEAAQTAVRLALKKAAS